MDAASGGAIHIEINGDGLGAPLTAGPSVQCDTSAGTRHYPVDITHDGVINVSPTRSCQSALTNQREYH
jgi:hypothetical protein